MYLIDGLSLFFDQLFCLFVGKLVQPGGKSISYLQFHCHISSINTIRICLNQGLYKMYSICMMFLLELHLPGCATVYPELGHQKVCLFEMYSEQACPFSVWRLGVDNKTDCWRTPYYVVQKGQTLRLSSIQCCISYFLILVKEFVLRLSFVCWVKLIMLRGSFIFETSLTITSQITAQFVRLST